MNRPCVNWDELAKLMRPAGPPRPEGKNAAGPGKGIGGWDCQADFYNQMASMEKEFTLNQINCLDIGPEDTVLDIGCGPGRITVPAAMRAGSVTSLDASPKMLEYCRKNAEAAGLENITTILADWEDDDSFHKIGMHDIVIASRSIALQDIEKMTSYARKYAAIVIWAHGYPSIPAITGELFKGTGENDTARPGPPVMKDRRVGNNLWYNRIYDMGYEPNLRIVDDGFTKKYESREKAYDDLSGLSHEEISRWDVFRQNTDRFLTDNEDGTVTFLAETKSIVLWWKSEKAE